ncbi:MAG: spermidine/putrescine ABC transporter substrate-binding protein [Oscillospiraceae bacterium]|nr:spermidine/putrescine ABC transporter substrate-binding protein [Oscillospiraceae bacterium]
MKKVLSIIISLFIMLTIFSGCSSNNNLKIYIWGEFISNGEDNSMDIKKEFENKYGVKINLTTFASNEEMYAKIKSGSAKYDLIVPSDYMINRMISEEMLEKIDFENIPNFSNVMENFKNPIYDPTGEYSIPYAWGLVGIIYNSKMITEDINSWYSLFNEKYSKEILMFNNPRDAFAIALKYKGYSLNSQNSEEFKQASDLLKKQQPIVQSYVMDEIFDKMINAEAIISSYYAGDFIKMEKDNPDLKFVLPKEGTNRFIDSMVIPKGSKNKNLAENFMNFILEPEVGLANIEYLGYSTPNKAVYELLPDDMKFNKNLYPDSSFLDFNTEEFIHLTDAFLENMDKEWLKIKSGNN